MRQTCSRFLFQADPVDVSKQQQAEKIAFEFNQLKKSGGCNFYIRFLNNNFRRRSFISIKRARRNRNFPINPLMFFSQILVEAGKLKAEFWKIGGVERNKRGRGGGSYGGLNYSWQIKRSELANIIYRPVGCLFRVV